MDNFVETDRLTDILAGLQAFYPLDTFGIRAGKRVNYKLISTNRL